MSKIYGIYLGLYSKDKDELGLKDLTNILNDLSNRYLIGMSYTVNYDNEGIFNFDLFNPKYDFDKYLINHIISKNGVKKIIEIEIFINLGEYSMFIKNKIDIERKIIQFLTDFIYPFVVKFDGAEEFVYPVKFKI